MKRTRASLLATIGFLATGTLFAHDSGQDVECFVAANVRFTVIHELAHAVLDVLEVPVLGRQEDAADQMAILAWMRPHPEHEHQLDELLMATDAWRLEWALHQFEGHGVDYWSDHSLDIQRFFNLACLIAGSDPEQLGPVQDALGLPHERAWFCEDEHRQSTRALEWVLEQHPPPADGPNDWLQVVYEPPATPWRQSMHERLQEDGTLSEIVERARALIGIPPPPIQVVFANCGEPGAYWRADLHEVVFCNELLDRFKHLAELRHCLPDLGNASELSAASRQCLAKEPQN